MSRMATLDRNVVPRCEIMAGVRDISCSSLVFVLSLADTVGMSSPIVIFEKVGQ